MADPRDSSFGQSPHQGRGQAPRPQNVGEGSSGTATPVPIQEAVVVGRGRGRGRGTSSASALGSEVPLPPVLLPEVATTAGRGITSAFGHGRGIGAPGAGGSSVTGSGLGRGSGGVGVLQIGGVLSAAAGGVVVPRRKRTREEGDAGAGPSQPVGRDNPPPPPLPPAAVAGQAGQYHCWECRKDFASDRALSGHMRMHRNRGWRGNYPPPTFDRAEFVEAGAGALLNPDPPLGGNNQDEEMEREEVEAAGVGVEVEVEVEMVLEKEAGGENIIEAGQEIILPAAEEEDVQRELEVRPQIDLNVAAEGEQERAMVAAQGEASTSGRRNVPDLNEPPPPDDGGNYL